MIHHMNPFQKLKRPNKPQTHDEGLWDTKKAKELKRKAVVEESSQDDKELKEIMRNRHNPNSGEKAMGPTDSS
ncbi:unnamed protein product [Prunus armeniaca]